MAAAGAAQQPARGGGSASGGSACSVCGAVARIDEAWLSAFGAALCYGCKQCDGLISKGKAKAQHLLTDNDLRPLGSLEKANPQHKAWTAMRMYLSSQVQEVAIKKHGSLSAIEALKDARADRKFAAAAEARKRGAADAAAQERQEAQLAARIEARAAQLTREAAAAEQEQIEETIDPETGVKRRRHGPQFAEVEVEQI